MTVGKITPEQNHAEDDGPEGESANHQQEPQAAAAAEAVRRPIGPRRHLTKLKYEFTKRRTIVFGIGMGLLLYVSGGVLLFVTIEFDLRDFLVMGSGAVIIGTIFVLIIIAMECRDSCLVKKALMPGEALVRSEDGYTKYTLVGNHRRSVVPATRIGSAADSEKIRNATPLRNTVIPESPKPLMLTRRSALPNRATL